MKHLLATCIGLLLLNVCLAQFERFVTIRPTVHVNVVLKGLGFNEIGAGFGLDASFFSKGRLQALVESSSAHFVGEKVLSFDTLTGQIAFDPAVFDVKLGPQYFLTRNLAVAITYGPSWHVFQDTKFTADYGLKYSLTGFWGRKRKFVTKLFLSDIPNDKERIQYLGFALGIKF